MSKAKQLFTKVAAQLDGAEITYEELAQKTGRSFNYIRNNSKSLAKAYGFNFVRANKRETLPRLLDATNFKRVINTYLATNNLPCAYPNLEPYTGRDVIPQTVARLLIKYKDAAQEACETIADATILAGVLSQISIPEPKISASAVKAISEAFYKTIRLVPEEEQTVAVFKSAKFFAGAYGITQAVIQSKAGASKSTCMLALQHYLQAQGLRVPTIIAKTNKSLEGVENSSTLASFLNKKLGINVVGCSLESILTLVEMKIKSEPTLKEESIIVDEYSMLHSVEVTIINLLADKVLYVGDILQLSNLYTYPGTVICTLNKQYRFINAEPSVQVEYSDAYYKGDMKRADEIEDSITENTFTGTLSLISPEAKYDCVTKTTYINSFEDIKPLLMEYAGDDHQIVAYSTSAVEEINRVVNGSEELVVGSKIVMDENLLDKGLSTGNLLRVIKLDEGFGFITCVEIRTQNIIHLPVNARFSLGFAITTTRAQGSQWEHVLGVTGTSNRSARRKDTYVLITRSSGSIKLIRRGAVDTSSAKAVSEFMNCKEGSRNTALYRMAQSLSDLAMAKGLPKEEVLTTIAKAVGLDLGKVHTSNENQGIEDHPEEELPTKPLDLQDNYCVLVPHPKTGQLYPRDRKNYKETEARATAISSKGSVAKALYKGNEVVLDCDSPEMVTQFEDLISQTESWVSPDRSKAHIVFKTDRWIPTNLSVKPKLDILGNATPNQMRYLKPNKHHNGLSPIMLTDEVLNRIHSSIDE